MSADLNVFVVAADEAAEMSENQKTATLPILLDTIEHPNAGNISTLEAKIAEFEASGME